MGALLSDGLREIAVRHPELGDIRGRGLMIGVEVIRPSQAGRPPRDGALTAAIKRAAFANGLVLESGGRDGAVLRFLPPLIVTPNDVGEILDRFEVAVSQAKRLSPSRSDAR
jgi:diaminobutyrate-2-oxoglutarate transaminase